MDNPTIGCLLVVDDDKVNRLLLGHYLVQQGHAVTYAENGRQALDILRAQPVEMVLLDIEMPEINGYQVLEQVIADPQLREIPIIVTSALEEMNSVVKCIEMGAEDYLTKPVNQVLLKARINASLDKKRLRDQEIEYLRNVKQITSAAAAIEAGDFATESLGDVARREDGLGQLARVFQSMAREVYTRELQLKQQVQQLRIELDEARQARRVTEITETEYFQKLLLKAQEFRQIIDDS
jgi:CheY-like chemotaxis protein